MGLADVAGLVLDHVVGGDRADLVDHGPGPGGEPLADHLHAADEVQEAVGLGEEGVLLHVRRMVGRRDGVVVVRDVVEGNARLVVLRVQEVLEELGLLGGLGQRHPHELQPGLHAAHGFHHRVVEARVGLRREAVLEVHLVQDFPVRDRVVMARLVALAELVGESSLGVPGQESRVVVRHLLEARIVEVAPLRVVPDRLVRVGGIGDGLLGLHHPLRNGAEVQDDRMAFGRLEEVDGHGVDEREVPGRLPVLGGSSSATPSRGYGSQGT